MLNDMPAWRSCFFAAIATAILLPASVLAEHELPTPLETAEYARLSTSQEISAYLAQLAREFPQARVERFGTTVDGRPLEALVLTGAPHGDVATADRLTVEIIGSQHGMEGAGSETLLFVARELLAGSLKHVLDDINVVLVPNANPDGREVGLRVNANQVNLNTDFVTLTQPESQALVESFQRYRPEVVLDVHESAILKKRSLAREGYMTDFTVQFEMANNPNIVRSLRTFAFEELLTPWIARVDAAGLQSHRYFGEITSSRQAVTNGGLSLNNLRNRAGIDGRLSFLMETRLDPKNGVYPTYRNIGQRVALQRISIERFLLEAHRKRADALEAVATARDQVRSEPLALDVRYVAEPGDPPVAIELRRIDNGQIERIKFADSRTVAAGGRLRMPAAYVVRGDQLEVRELLDRHSIRYQVVDKPRRRTGVEFSIDATTTNPGAALDKVRERSVRVDAQPGDLWIDLDQSRGRLAALLLEPRSDSSLLRTPAFSPLVATGQVLPIYRIPR
jgi:hypothetical protein